MLPKPSASTAPTNHTISQKQIQGSLSKLEKLKADHIRKLSKIRISSNYTENERMINQDLVMGNISQKIRAEQKQSRMKNAAIAMRWPLVLQQTIPSEIKKELSVQEEACERILRSKESLIEELKGILRSKDEEYVKTLVRQDEEVNELIQQMRISLDELSSSYEEELGKIEESFDSERKNLLQESYKSIKLLTEQRKEKESEVMKHRMEAVEENEKKLQALIEAEMEKYAQTKKENDDRLHELEVSIDKMRAVFEHNSEKLKYYHSVLYERVSENHRMKENNRKKLNQLREQLTNIKTKYKKDDEKFKQKNRVLTEQYARMAKQYKDLTQKFRCFEIRDRKKYKEIWKMNESEIHKLLNDTVTADKIITERILNQVWEPPSLNRKSSSQDEDDDERETRGLEHLGGGDTIGGGKVEGPSILGGGIGLGRTSHGENKVDPLKKKLFTHLCDNTGFLVEDRLRNALSRIPRKEEQDLLKLDSVLKEFGIRSKKDVSRFEKLLASQVGDLEDLLDPSKDAEEILQVRLPEDVIVRLISQFVIEKRMMESERDVKSKKKKKKIKLLNLKQLEKLREEKEEREFWERFETVIPEEKYKLWCTLEGVQQKYHKVLVKRKKLLEEISCIRRQNIELEELLNDYVNQKINEELYIPPRIL